jgi:hypothetical protein
VAAVPALLVLIVTLLEQDLADLVCNTIFLELPSSTPQAAEAVAISILD